MISVVFFFFFFFNDTATTEIYTLSLHDALPISTCSRRPCLPALAEPDRAVAVAEAVQVEGALARLEPLDLGRVAIDEATEARDDVPAGVVLGLLHLMHDRDALGRVGFGRCLVVQRPEVGPGTRLRRPVRLVVRGV